MFAMGVADAWISPKYCSAALASALQLRLQFSLPRRMQGEHFMYSSFFGEVLALTEFRGRYVSVLLPPSWIDALSLEERRALLDRSDLMYAHFAELMGAEPAGNGPLRIAIVRETCGWGCGQIGTKGIEVLDAEWSLNFVRADLAAGSVPSVITHEMSHNFDIYWNYLNALPEYGHAWTAFLDAYIQVYSRQGYQYISPEDLLQIRIEERLQPYLDDPKATWSATSFNSKVMLAWGGIMLRIAQDHGPRAIIETMRELGRYAAVHLPPETPEEKSDLQIRMLASGVGRNLEGYLDSLRWCVSPDVRAWMRSVFGPLDAPREVERDTVVDVVVAHPSPRDYSGRPFVAPIPFPARVRGVGTTSVDDHFAFTLPGPTHVRFLIRPSTAFEGWLLVHAEDRSSWLASVAIEPGTTTSTSIRYPSGGSWELSVFHPGKTPAAYELDVAALAPWPTAWGTVSPPVLDRGTYRLSLEVLLDPCLSLRTPCRDIEARFWVSSIGFVGTVPLVGNGATYAWAPPPNTRPGIYGYRAQLFISGIPLTRDTESVHFVVGGTAGSLATNGSANTASRSDGAPTWMTRSASLSPDPRNS
jgi:hypothetical protein